MRPTFRAKVRVGYKSNTNFRNHSTGAEFLGDEEITGLIMKVKEGGAQVIEFAGGEPTLLKNLPAHISLCRSALLGTSVITNGTAGKNVTAKLLNAGVQEFVVEVFGSADTQEKLLGLKKVRDHQERFCTQAREAAGLRFRFEILKETYQEIAKTAKWMAKFKPFMVDFVMNPYEVWGVENVPDMDILEAQLNEAIALLEYEGIGVNIRHYPMCRVEEIFRKNICNFKHVLFDPFQYDMGITPRNERTYTTAGEQFSADYEYKEAPCNGCSLHRQCGGAPRAIVEAAGKDFLKPVAPDGEGTVHIYYRGENKKCLFDSRQDNGLCDPDSMVEENGLEKEIIKPVVVRRPESEGKLCVVAVCGLGQQWYIPLFLFNLRREYPEYTPVVFVRGEPDPDVRRLCLDADVRVFENDEYPETEQVTSALKYLIDDEVVRGYPYALISEIDRLFFRESPSLLDQHLRALEVDGTEVYENWLYGNSVNPLMQSTLFVTREWWGRTAAALEDMREVLKNEAGRMLGSLSFQGDGYIIGNIISKSGLKLPPQRPKLWRSHGIRMRLWGNSLNKLRLDVFEKNHVRDLLRDPIFLTIAERCGKECSEILEMMRRWRLVVK